MKCNDCNGTGTYQGFTVVETCKVCNGTGKVQVPDSLPDDATLNAARPRPMVPAVGERIYYYVEDIEGTVTHVDENERYFEASFTCGRGHGSFSDLVWNVTNDRWEITRTRVQ